jgi:hypothetical protein
VLANALPLLVVLLLLLKSLTSFFGVAVLFGLLKFEFDFMVSWMAVTPENGW